MPAVKKNGCWSGESTLRHMVSHKPIPVAINSFLIYDKSKTPIGLGTIQRDITKQKEAENEVQKLAPIVQNSSDFIGIAGLNGKALFLNDAGKKLIGLEPSGVDDGFNLMDHFDDAGKSRMTDFILPEVMEKGRWVGEIEFKNVKTERKIPVMQDLFRIDDPITKKPVCFATITKDISEQKIAMMQLKKWKHLFDSAKWGIAIGEIKSDSFETINDSFIELHGYNSKEELIGTPIRDLYTKESLQSMRGVLKKLKSDGHCEFEALRIRKDGSQFPALVEVAIVSDENDQAIYKVTHVHDITQRKREEEELQKSTRVQKILDKSSEISRIGTWELDLITSELTWSDVTKKIHEVPLDYEPQLESAINYYVEGYSRDKITEVVNRAIEFGEQHDVELEIQTANGTIKQVRAIIIPETEKKKVVRLLGVFQDQTEQKMRLRKTNRVQTILDKSSEISRTGTWELDLITSELTWSDVTKKIHEVPLDYEPKLETAINYYVEGYSRDKITEVVNTAIVTGEQYDVELEIITAKNHIKQVRAIGIPETEDGQVVRLLGVFQDQTAQKKMEQQLRENEAELERKVLERTRELASANSELEATASKLKSAYDQLAKSESKFRLLTENANDIVVQYEFDSVENKFKKIYCSPSIKKTLGYSYEEWVKKPAFYHVHPDDVENVRSFFIDSIDNRLQHATTVVRLIHKNGEIVWLEGNSHFSYQENGNILISTVDRDITSQKMAEEKLLKSEKQYRFLAENSHDVVIAYNGDLGVTYVSPAIQNLTGYTVEETMEIDETEMVHPDDLPPMIELFKNAIQNRTHDQILRYRRKVKKGGYIWVETAVSFIYDSDDTFLSMIINVRDISTQMQAEEELESTQSQLIQAEKMASLGVLTAGIAHEINNPVNFIYAGINSLEDNLKDVRKILNVYEEVDTFNAEVKLSEVKEIKSELQYDKLLHFMDRSTVNIKKGAERTSEIISGLKTFSRSDAGEVILTDIHDSLDNTLLLLRNQYKDHITVSKKYRKIPMIECYPGKLNQVFVNVFANAIQAIDKEGTITIATKKIKRAGIEFIVIAITDDGTGVDKKLKNRIFEPFFTTKDVGKGTGLGLSISHGIIEKHRGTLEVESEKGKYTTFKIELPVKLQTE